MTPVPQPLAVATGRGTQSSRLLSLSKAHAPAVGTTVYPGPVATARGSVTPRAISVSMKEAQVTPQTPTVERTLTTEIKLYYDVHLSQQTPAPLLIALHGYGAGMRPMMREAQNLAPEEVDIVSLHGPHQLWKEAKAPGRPLRSGFGRP